MIHLCYIYIRKYRVLEGIGLTFDSHFLYEMKESVLSIRKNKRCLPDDFWGKGLFSVSAIAGMNGSGKTTALGQMRKLLISGASKDSLFDGIVVYEEDGHILAFNPKKMKIDVGSDVTFHEINEIRPIDTFYYSGHFEPYMTSDDMELSGSYFGSDGWLLIKDLQTYSNVASLHLSEPLYNHLLAYWAQNNYRICELLQLEGLADMLKSLRLPRYVQIAPNRSGWSAISLNRKGKFDDIVIPPEQWTSKSIKNQALEQLVYYNILNLIAEDKGNHKDLADYLKYWMQNQKDESIADSIERHIPAALTDKDSREGVRALKYIIEKVDQLCDFDETSGSFYIEIKNGADKLRMLQDDMLRHSYFLTAKFFDIFYSHDLLGATHLSSGEQELLNLLSRLYDGIYLRPKKFHSINPPRILLLDEAEIGFHPELQRQYVKLLTDFLQYFQLKENEKASWEQRQLDFQIIITTHSPIIMSDMPVDCVNFLEKKEDGSIQKNSEKETFGQNIYNLYKRTFFMKEGLIGAFASDKIERMYKRVIGGEHGEKLINEIQLIGDERIKGYLLHEMSKNDYDARIAYFEARIEQLKREKANETNRS